MNRIDYEIRSQLHLMDAEGCQKEKPTIEEIIYCIKEDGYIATNIRINHDDMMGLWRWSCDIEEIKQ